MTVNIGETETIEFRTVKGTQTETGEVVEVGLGEMRINPGPGRPQFALNSQTGSVTLVSPATDVELENYGESGERVVEEDLITVE